MVRLDGLRATQLVGCITVDPTSEWSTHLSLLLVLLLPGLRVWYGCRIYVTGFVCDKMWGLQDRQHAAVGATQPLGCVASGWYRHRPHGRVSSLADAIDLCMLLLLVWESTWGLSWGWYLYVTSASTARLSFSPSVCIGC